MTEIEIIILAAGGSRRFGLDNKLLQPWGDRSVIAAVVATALGSSPSRLVVVTGWESEWVEQTLAPFNSAIELCHHRDWQDGMGSSLAAGVRFLGQASQAPLMIMLGDMPSLTVASLNQISSTAQRNPDRIIQPFFRAIPGHPVVWPAEFRPALAQLQGDQGGKSIIATQAERLLRLEWADDSILHDIDTVDDYQRLKS